MNADQQSQLQAEVQRELERREWAEPGDAVMAEYITVLLANGNSKDRVQTEMDDLVGSDFDARFLDWLFDTAQDTTATTSAPPAPSRSPSAPAPRSTSGSSRLLNSALAPLSSQPEKRKFDDRSERDDRHDVGQNKRRVSDGVPSGPRQMGSEGKSLADRLSGRGTGFGGRGGGMAVRGAGGRSMGPGFGNGNGMGNGHMGRGGGGFQNQAGFRNNNNAGPGMMQPGFGGFFPPGQQEMMAQMMMMQASMAQMGDMMQKMAEERDNAQMAQAPPVRPIPAKIPPGTKLGSHAVSTIPPKKSGAPAPIPEKPTQKALCRFDRGCTNARCPYSHPSPVATEEGLVLSEEACEAGRNCKDPECIKSHVSPAAVEGVTAGPSRMLCKYLNCTNPSCQFRHEDENGNPIPPPALTAKQNKPIQSTVQITTTSGDMSDNDDGDVEVVMNSKSLMDGALDDKPKDGIKCRYGENCTRADCKFSHPAGRKLSSKRAPFKKGPANGSIGGGMNVSKKFGASAAPASAEKKLDPSVSEFKPATTPTTEA